MRRGSDESSLKIGEAFKGPLGAIFSVGIEADFLLETCASFYLDVELRTFLIGVGEDLKGLIGWSYWHLDCLL